MTEFAVAVAARLAPLNLFVPASSPSDAMKFLIDSIVTELDNFFPKKKTNRIRKDLPWITADIREQMRIRDQILSQLQKCLSDPSKKASYAEAVKRVKESLSKARHKFFAEFDLSTVTGWMRVKEIQADVRSVPTMTHLDQECGGNTGVISEKLNNFYVNCATSVQHRPACNFKDLRVSSASFKFELLSDREVYNELRRVDTHKATGPDGIAPFIIKRLACILALPLTNIFNCSFLSGEFPESLKDATVKSIPKKDNPTELTDWRPISILPVFTKVLERIAHRQIVRHLKENELISRHQHGFMAKLSTKSLFLESTDRWRKSIDNGEIVLVTLIDLRKAFDSVDHNLLMEKINTAGFYGSELKWSESYLTNRKQRSEWKGTSPCLISSVLECHRDRFSDHYCS